MVNQAADELAVLLKKQFGYRVMGPEFPLVNRIQSWFIKNIFVKIERDKSFEKAKEIMDTLSGEMKQKDGYKSLQLQFDVDPM